MWGRPCWLRDTLVKKKNKKNCNLTWTHYVVFWGASIQFLWPNYFAETGSCRIWIAWENLIIVTLFSCCFFFFAGKIVWVSIAVLVMLFAVQRFGTAKVGYAFSPILTLWFVLIGGIGIFNFFKHDPSVIKALNPTYIIHYFKRNKKNAWISLGGIILCTTG